MQAHEMVALLRRRPFKPLRIILTDGKSYDITHPDMVIVLTQSFDIAQGPKVDAGGGADHVDRCNLVQVSRVEEIPQASGASTTGNGKGS